MYRLVFRIAIVLSFVTQLSSADWNQWRGPRRDGVAPNSPPLISEIPDGGLEPLWKIDGIPSAWSGGWGSPVVANGRVFLYVHSRVKEVSKNEPERKFPWVPPEKRPDWSEEKFAEYEKNRRDEDEKIGKSLYTFTETLYCFDSLTGKALWSTAQPSLYTRFLQSNSATVVDGRVYVLGAAYTMKCFAADDGKELWSQRLPGEFRDEFRMASVLVVDGLAVVQVGRLFGLDAKTGKVVWEGDSEGTAGSHSSPVVWSDGNTTLVLANVEGGRTIAIDPRTGTQIWRIDSQAGLSTPVVAGDHLITFGNSRKKGLRCFRIAREGAEHLWTFQGLADKGSSPLVHKGHVFVQGERRLACVDLETGKAAWQTTLRLRNPQFSSLLSADDKVFYGCEGLLAFKASPEKFAPLVDVKIGEGGIADREEAWRRRLDLENVEKGEDGAKKAANIWREKVEGNGPLPCATPAIFDGRLLVRLKDGLVCYDLRAERS